MAVYNTKIFSDNIRGASIIEVILAMAIVGLAAPFIYNQISRVNHEIQTISLANKIVSVRDDVLNFVRLNQDDWPDVAQIKLTDDELQQISSDVVSGFIDKYTVSGATVTDVYLAFDVAKNELESNQIVKKLGADAAVVGADGVAHSSAWAVGAPDFASGQIIFRISRDFAGQDRSMYLHRGSSGDGHLNQMQRDLNMGGNEISDVAGIDASSAKIQNTITTFVDAEDVHANSINFASGANMDGANVSINSLRVTGDTSGFKNMVVGTFNSKGHTTTGRIIADRATINKKIDVAKDLVLKSSSVRTISDFTAMSVNSAFVPFVSTNEIVFYNDYGLTVTGELLVSDSVPLKIGNWSFPSNNLPKFNKLTLTRANINATPNVREFSSLYNSAWQTIPSKAQVIQ